MADTVNADAYVELMKHQYVDLVAASVDFGRLFDHAFDSNVHHSDQLTPSTRLARFVQRRAEGQPMAHILGTIKWGGLEFICRPGTLIPRPASETVQINLAKVIQRLRTADWVGLKTEVQILDVGTGSGCCPLLLHSTLHPPDQEEADGQPVKITGIDVSEDCIANANENLKHNVNLKLLHPSALEDVSFAQIDLVKVGQALDLDQPTEERGKTGRRIYDAPSLKLINSVWPVMFANLPCISTADYEGGIIVTYTDRTFEPKIAIVPPEISYAQMEELGVPQSDLLNFITLQTAVRVKSKLLVLETFDGAQSTRILDLAAKLCPSDAWFERWMDSMVWSGAELQESASLDVGTPRGRAVAIWMGDWAEWRKKACVSNGGKAE